jgi:hypothetical protein
MENVTFGKENNVKPYSWNLPLNVISLCLLLLPTLIFSDYP